MSTRVAESTQKSDALGFPRLGTTYLPYGFSDNALTAFGMGNSAPLIAEMANDPIGAMNASGSIGCSPSLLISRYRELGTTRAFWT